MRVFKEGGLWRGCKERGSIGRNRSEETNEPYQRQPSTAQIPKESVMARSQDSYPLQEDWKKAMSG